PFDLFVVPTLTFERLFAFLVLGHDRRRLLWFEVTRHPTAAWLARQITEAFPWASAPAYLVRDNDRAYGHVFTSRGRAMGIRDGPISPRSPWQNPYVERLIGTVRRECLDRVLVFGEAQFSLLMLRTTMRSARTWRWAKTRRWVGQFSGPASLSPSRSCLGSTTITSGYDFRKAHRCCRHGTAVRQLHRGVRPGATTILSDLNAL